MRTYTLGDAEIDLDPNNPEDMAWAKANGAKAKERSAAERAVGAGKALGSGLVEGAARLPFLLSDVLNLGLDTTKAKLNPEWMNSDAYRQFREAHKGSGWVDAGLEAAGTGFYRPEGDLERYLNVGAQGAGGAAMAAVPRIVAPTARVLPRSLGFKPEARSAELLRNTAKRAVVPGAAAGATGAVAGLGAEDATGNPLVGLGVGALAGGLAGGWLGHTPVPDAALARAGQAYSPDDFAAARRNLAMFNRAGVKTATLPDAFPTEGPLHNRLRESVDIEGTTAATAPLKDRPDELLRLQGQAIEAVGPKRGDILSVAGQAQNAAAARLAAADKAATRAFRSKIEGAAPIPQAATQAYQQQLLGQAARATRDDQRSAAEAVAEILTKPERPVLLPGNPPIDTGRTIRPFKTDPNDISLPLREFQRNPAAAVDRMSAGKKVSAGEVRPFFTQTDEWLRQQSPEYRAAIEQFQRVKGAANEMREGPLKTLAGTENDLPAPPTPSRLEAITAKQDAPAIERTMRSLGRGAPENPNLRQDIARAILEQRVASTSGDARYSRLMGGQAGDLAEEGTRALVRAGQGNMPAFDDATQSLRLLERVPNLPGQAGAEATSKRLQQSLLTTLANPLYATSMGVTQASRKGNYMQIAAMLAKTDPAMLARLEQLRKTDPAKFSQLVLGGGLLSGNAGLPPEER